MQSRRFYLPIGLVLSAMMITACAPLDEEPRARRRDDGVMAPRPAVPETARIVREGRSNLSFRAPSNGLIYLYSVEDNRVLHVQDIERGQRFNLNPQENLATLNGRPVFTRRLGRDYTHRIYFDPEPRRR